MKKRIMSVLTAILIMVTMFVTAIPANAWIEFKSPTSTSGSDYTDYPAFAAALDEIFAGDIDAFTNSSRTKEASLPLGSRISMNNAYYIYSTSRKVSTYGWTCFIYSNAAFNKLFGEYVHRGTGLKNCYIAVNKGASKMTYELLRNNDIRTGAYIRTSPKSDGSYYGEDGHSMIILAYDNTHITYLEGNGDGKGLVRVTKRTYSEFNSAQLSGKGRKITHIVQPTQEWFNTLYGKRPEDNTYSFSYDTNSGDGYQEDFTVKYNNEFCIFSNKIHRDGYRLIGWKIKRDIDNKWYTEDGWNNEDGTVFYNGTIIKFDKSFITDTIGDVSYTAYAVWEDLAYEICTEVSLISAGMTRDSFPVGSTVSLAGSEIEFSFVSGNKAKVIVNNDCSATTPQTFLLDGIEYSFYIDSTIKTEGENPCYVRLNYIKDELLSLTGDKILESTEIISDPNNISGENTKVKITYTNGASETVTATKFTPLSCDQNSVRGVMWTDGGFAIDWSFLVKSENDIIDITYSCGYRKTTVAGDINLDGEITTGDLAALKLILIKPTNSLYSLYCTADIDCDGTITSTDLAVIKLQLAGN